MCSRLRNSSFMPTQLPPMSATNPYGLLGRMGAIGGAQQRRYKLVYHFCDVLRIPVQPAGSSHACTNCILTALAITCLRSARVLQLREVVVRR